MTERLYCDSLIAQSVWKYKTFREENQPHSFLVLVLFVLVPLVVVVVVVVVLLLLRRRRLLILLILLLLLFFLMYFFLSPSLLPFFSFFVLLSVVPSLSVFLSLLSLVCLFVYLLLSFFHFSFLRYKLRVAGTLSNKRTMNFLVSVFPFFSWTLDLEYVDLAVSQ